MGPRSGVVGVSVAARIFSTVLILLTITGGVLGSHGICRAWAFIAVLARNSHLFFYFNY